MSLNRQAANSVKQPGANTHMSNDEKNHLADLKADLRTAHFDLGTNKNIYQTTSGQSMVPHAITQSDVVNAELNRRN